jgi:hypothetical protein
LFLLGFEAGIFQALVTVMSTLSLVRAGRKDFIKKKDILATG